MPFLPSCVLPPIQVHSPYWACAAGHSTARQQYIPLGNLSLCHFWSECARQRQAGVIEKSARTRSERSLSRKEFGDSLLRQLPSSLLRAHSFHLFLIMSISISVDFGSARCRNLLLLNTRVKIRVARLRQIGRNTETWGCIHHL